MNSCRQKRVSVVLGGVVLLCFFGLLLVCIYALVSGDPRLYGDTMTEYGTVDVDKKYYWAGTILLGGTILYLFNHMRKTGGSAILFDERNVIFCPMDGEERRFSWREVREPDIHLEWVVTPQVKPGQVLLIRFEDGAKMAVSQAFENYWEFCRALEEWDLFAQYGLPTPEKAKQ